MFPPIKFDNNVNTSLVIQLHDLPTFGTPPATVKPTEPVWYMGAVFMQTYVPTMISVEEPLHECDADPSVPLFRPPDLCTFK